MSTENGPFQQSDLLTKTCVQTILDYLNTTPSVHVNAFVFFVDLMTRVIFVAKGLTDVLQDTVI